MGYSNKIYCDICNKHISRLESKPIYTRKRNRYSKVCTLCFDCYLQMIEHLGIREK